MTDCGCRIVHKPVGKMVELTGNPVEGLLRGLADVWPTAIEYCPLHAAAEQMRDELENLVRRVSGIALVPACKALDAANAAKRRPPDG